MKKTISLILCLLLVFVFCSCNKEIVTTATTTTESPAMETSQSKPSTMEFSFAFTSPNLEEQIQKSHLLVKATYQCSGTDYIEMEGCEIESFFDRYAITEVLYGEYTEERIDLEYLPYDYIEVDTQKGYFPADTNLQITKTEGEEYLLLLYFYNSEWRYSDFRFVIPAEAPSSMLVADLSYPCVLNPIADDEHTVPLTDIDTQEKFVQYALTLINTLE